MTLQSATVLELWR